MSTCAVTQGVRQKGFTLIEMSIVLVIIGLIIGGILKGQEIIESSRQKNMMAQFDALRGAVNTFVDRFGAIPGDFALATTRLNTGGVAINGGGDGILGTAVATATTIGSTNGAAANSENLQFFIHLAAADLLEGVTMIDAAPTTFGVNSALPAAPFSGTGLSVVQGTYANVASDTRSAVWVRVHRNPTAPAAGLSPAQMYQMDTKVDDGIAAMGSFRSNLATNCGTAVTTQDYVFSDNNIQCIAIVDIVN